MIQLRQIIMKESDTYGDVQKRYEGDGIRRAGTAEREEEVVARGESNRACMSQLRSNRIVEEAELGHVGNI